MQTLPQLDVHASKAGAARCGSRTFERGIGILYGGERFRRQRTAKRIERRLPRQVRLPLNVQAQRIDDLLCRGRYFGPDTIARDERDAVRHWKLPIIASIRKTCNMSMRAAGFIPAGTSPAARSESSC